MELPKIITHKNMTVKLYNWMDYPKGKRARNVEAFDANGKKLWTIESLGGEMEISDFYTDIFSNAAGQLCAFNYQAYLCVIDENTGKVLSSHFTK